MIAHDFGGAWPTRRITECFRALEPRRGYARSLRQPDRFIYQIAQQVS